MNAAKAPHAVAYRRRRRSGGLLVAGVALSLYAFAARAVTAAEAVSAAEPVFWSVQLENDAFAGKEDRFYTGGLEISRAGISRPRGFMHAITGALPFYRSADTGVVGWSVGFKVFNPENQDTAELVTDDRPYAGWTYLDSGIVHRYRDDGQRDAFNAVVLTLGIVGPHSYAQDIQDSLHKRLDVDLANGWQHQLHDEPGLMATYIRKWRVLSDLEAPRQFELSHHAGATLGNIYTLASYGVMLRWGNRLKSDVGPPAISPAFPGIPAFQPDNRFNWYLYLGAEGRALARNIFLDGNTDGDSHSVDKKPFVGDVVAGFVLHYGNVRLAISNTYRSREFEGQSEAFKYGAINVTWLTP